MVYLVFLLALGLRLINLNQSLWLDEAVQAITAQRSFSYIFQEITGDFHPPLYHFLMHFWVRLFGSSEIALRMPSVLFGVGTVWLIYLIVNKLTGLRVKGLITAMFMATAPFHVYYSQEARMYSLVTFLAAASMYYFIRVNELTGLRVNGFMGLRVCGLKEYFLYFVFTGLAVYVDYFGFLILSAQSLILFWQKKYKFLVHCSLFIVLIYLPWLPMFIKQLQEGMAATAALPQWGRLVNLSFFKALPLTFIKFALGRITIFNKLIYAIVASFLFLVYGGLIFNSKFKIQNVKLKFKVQKFSTGEIVVFSWLLVPVVLAWGLSLFVPNYQPFRLLLVLPAFYILLALGTFSFKNKSLKVVSIAFVLVVNLVSLFAYYTNPYFQREDWKSLTAFLEKQKNAVVILPSNTSDWPIKYYDTGNNLKLVYGSEGIKSVNELTGLRVNGLKSEVNELFYIRYLVPLFDPNEKILKELESQGFIKTKEFSFNQIMVWKYVKS